MGDSRGCSGDETGQRTADSTDSNGAPEFLMKRERTENNSEMISTLAPSCHVPIMPL